MASTRFYANIGDLVKVKECDMIATQGVDWSCDCFFCRGRSNRVGLIIGPMPNASYEVAFDVGTLQIYDHEFCSGHVEVISE